MFNSSTIRSRRRCGFALIITLSLMVLLVVVAVGLLTLSSIALRSSQTERYQSEARANARLALMLALGELQVELGPDQRVSARAAILDEDSATDTPDGIANPHWLGVWNSWDDWLNNPAIKATYDQGRTNKFRRWLVSSPDPALTNSLSLARSPAPADAVVMVSASDLAGIPVKVSSVKAPKNGRFAWWVTGENQKARVDGPAATPDSDSNRLYARSQWSRAGADWLDGLEKIPIDPAILNRVVSLPTLGLGATGGDIQPTLRARFHDLTTDSIGLLTNTRRGGLKKDLNLLLELPKLPAAFGDYSATKPLGTIVPIRPHQGYLPKTFYTQGLNFPSWYKLHQFYQLYRGGGEEAAADCQPVPFKGAGFWGSASSPNINFNWHTANLDYYGYGRTPIVTRLMLVFSTRRVASASGGTFDYKLGVNPVVTLWNPYNVTMHSPRLSIQITPGALQYKAYVNGGVVVDWTQLRRSGNKPFELNIYPMEGPNLTTTPIVLKPGETRIYSAVSGFVNAADFLHSELYPGYQPPDSGGGFEVGLQGLTGLPGSAVVELAMRMNDTRTDHGGQYQVYWTVRNAQNNGQRYNELAANPVEEGKPIYLAPDQAGKRVRFSNSSTRIPFANFQFIAKSGEDLRNPGTDYSQQDFRCRNFIQANPVNPRAMYGEATARMRGMAQYQVQIQTGSGNSLNPDFDPATKSGYLGSAVSLGQSRWPGQPKAVVAELPLVPVTSLASFAHHRLIPGDSRDFATGRHLWDVSANQALAIGNSFAHPLIAGDAIYQDVADASCRGSALQMKLIRDFHDHAFLSNDALWDDWFCSGITRENEGLFKNNRNLGGVVRQFQNSGVPLKNPHLMPWTASLEPGKTLDTLLVSGSNPTANAHEIAARYLVIRGAFNINSTSVEAWQAFLAGLREKEITWIDPATGTLRTTNTPDDRVVFSRFSLPASAEEGANAGDPRSWLGIRALTREQIRRLAVECVRQVKQRGPFLNLSDFVNRRLATDETGVCGALQAAIDWDEFLSRTPASGDAESINGRFKGGDDFIDAAKVSNWGLPFPQAARGSRFAGIPGYLTQADVLKRVGNMITSRDDTFRIRSYGEARDALGNIQARTWCEAVVQRTPANLDAADSPETPSAGLTSNANKKFGRRFGIVSFRWLSPNEI